MQERRKYPRIDVSLPVECEILPSRDYFYTVSKDLSLAGARILSNNFIPKNGLLKLSINFINKVLDLKTRVIWCSQERASERYSAGLEFVEVDTEARKELSEFLNSAYNS